MNHITYDFSAAKGRIKAMHAVGQPPMMHANLKYLRYLTDANIPYSRLHDTGGPYGGCVYVDIPNIFRDFDADENDPASYDFAFTDHLLKGLKAANCEPYYRLGVTIENFPEIKSYHIAPPKDFAKWARICEHIIRHYNEGWADGFEMGITYWEIWNEPDDRAGDAVNSCMWQSTPEQYYQLYEITAKHLKACFGDTIKIGGFASNGFDGASTAPKAFGLDIPGREEGTVTPAHRFYIEFFRNFLQHIKKTGAPMDFFSWHSYNDVETTKIQADFCAKVLEEYGYTDCEVHCNEWNNARLPWLRGTSYACAAAAAMMLVMQNTRTDIMCYYDARIGQSVYGGLFNPITHKPFCTYYAFKAFGEMYRLGTQASAEIDGKSLYSAAAMDGENKAVMIANVGKLREITTNLPADMKAYLIDETHMLEETPLDPAKFTLIENTVVFFKNF